MRLLLLRHAKSGWNRPGKPDAERPLDERGNQAAPAIGRYMKAHGLIPGLILCSSARRARETLAHIFAAFETETTTVSSDAIYDADPHELLAIIREYGHQTSPLLVIGHNPTIQDLALDLIGSGERALIDRIHEKYPTAALAILDVDIASWRDLERRRAKLAGFVRPRDIA